MKHKPLNDMPSAELRELLRNTKPVVRDGRAKPVALEREPSLAKQSGTSGIDAGFRDRPNSKNLDLSQREKRTLFPPGLDTRPVAMNRDFLFRLCLYSPSFAILRTMRYPLCNSILTVRRVDRARSFVFSGELFSFPSFSSQLPFSSFSF